jgi:hypothetical protein
MSVKICVGGSCAIVRIGEDFLVAGRLATDAEKDAAAEKGYSTPMDETAVIIGADLLEEFVAKGVKEKLNTMLLNLA